MMHGQPIIKSENLCEFYKKKNGMLLPKYIWASQADFITKWKNMKKEVTKIQFQHLLVTKSV